MGEDSTGANPFARARLKWAASRSVGRVSEIAVMAPIKLGCVPLERRTYEERLRAVISNLAGRADQHVPNELDRIPTIHFGRMFIIRPEQYLVYSERVTGVAYSEGASSNANENSFAQIPEQTDDFASAGLSAEGGTAPNSDAILAMAGLRQRMPDAPVFRSWLYTLVEFDGDLRVYMRDIAVFLAEAFDLVFQNCEDFPGTADFETFWLWLRRYQFATDLFYARYSNLSVTRIKQLEEFKRRFDLFVAEVRPASGPNPQSMDELFDQFLRDTQQQSVNFPSPGGVYARGRDTR